jgi:hypothetical protein
LKSVVIKEHIRGLKEPSKWQSRGVRSEILGDNIIENPPPNHGTNIWHLKGYLHQTEGW